MHASKELTRVTTSATARRHRLGGPFPRGVTIPGNGFERNVANFNTAYGISGYPGATDLGGNSAKGNGNPHECLEVICS